MHHVDAKKITLPSSGNIIQWANLQKRKNKQFNKTKLCQLMKGEYFRIFKFCILIILNF